MFLYKFRAESIVDVTRYFNMFPCQYFQVSPIPPIGSDCEVVIGTNKSLEEIRDEMDHIPDGHVMIETLNHHDKYNGDRWFDY